MFAAAAGNHQLAGLLAAFDGMENNIFLQHTIIAEGRSARFKNMNPMNLQIGEKIFPERTKIGAVAKASRGDAHKLPARNQASAE